MGKKQRCLNYKTYQCEKTKTDYFPLLLIYVKKRDKKDETNNKIVKIVEQKYK